MKKLILSFLLISLPAFAVPFKASQIAMSARCPYATAAGQKISEQGGNAVDVALTMLVTMSVTNPSFASLGGGGFAMVKIGSKVEVLDFREVAPIKTHREFFVKLGEDSSVYGGAAVAVPGLPAGIYELHKKYGKIHWSKLFDEAIRLADRGFRVTGGWAEDTIEITPQLNPAGKKYFLKADGANYKPGELFKQPQLAKLLKSMRNRKLVDFYQGEGARDIVDTVSNTGGVISLEDLKNYRPVWREPLTQEINGYKLYLMPPPSSGGLVMQQAFRLINLLNVDKLKPMSIDEYHALAEVLKRSYRGRSLLGDPKFHKNPTELLLSDKYLKEMADSYKLTAAVDLKPLTDTEPGKESTETSHLSVLTTTGDAVAMTFTVNGSYGSGVVTEKYGIVLNNEMDDFTTHPGKPNMYGLIQGEGNTVAPGKRPLSSMSPTLIEKSGKIIGAIGAPGGPRIISSVFQATYRLLYNGFDVDRAIQTPRVHHQFLPNTLFVDEGRFSPDIIDALKKRKHEVKEDWNALVYAVFNRDGVLEAAYDSRGEGSVAGY